MTFIFGWKLKCYSTSISWFFCSNWSATALQFSKFHDFFSISKIEVLQHFNFFRFQKWHLKIEVLQHFNFSILMIFLNIRNWSATALQFGQTPIFFLFYWSFNFPELKCCRTSICLKKNLIPTPSPSIVFCSDWS